MSTSPRWHTREDSGLRLDRDGNWWHDDVRVEHPRIIEVFNQGLEPAEGGRFILRVGQDWCFVTVEDTAYHVLAVDDIQGVPWLLLSDRTTEPLEPASLELDPEGALRCRVKSGRAAARFTRGAQFQLGAWLVEAEGRFHVQLPTGLFPVRSVHLS